MSRGRGKPGSRPRGAFARIAPRISPASDRATVAAAVAKIPGVLTQQHAGNQAGAAAQPGLRGATAGGQHLNPLAEALVNLMVDMGIARDAIRREVTLDCGPALSKKLDIFVQHPDNAFLLSMELKSVGGSYRKNRNNRLSEARGDAAMLRQTFARSEIPHFLGFVYVVMDDGTGALDAPYKGASGAHVLPGTTSRDWQSMTHRQVMRETFADLVSPGIYDGLLYVETDAQGSRMDEPIASAGTEAYLAAVRDFAHNPASITA